MFYRKLLLDGANIEVVDPIGRTPLAFAIINSHKTTTAVTYCNACRF